MCIKNLVSCGNMVFLDILVYRHANIDPLIIILCTPTRAKYSNKFWHQTGFPQVLENT